MAVIKIVKGNLLDATEDIIAHQVNCMGVMGAGVAKQIKENYPKAFEMYKRACDRYKNFPTWNYGTCQLVICQKKTGENKLIANLFGQFDYGRERRAYTSESQFTCALTDLCDQAHDVYATSIAMPYKIGCGLAGGNWENIYKIIEGTLSDFDVTLYKLED